MNAGGAVIRALLLGGLSLGAVLTSPQAPRDGFTLAGFIPNDVFLYVAEQHNPERQFLEAYWGEVLDALAHSGVGQDVLALIGSVLGAKPAAEARRLQERAGQLLDGVDWQQLAGRELVFAERFGPVAPLAAGPPPVMLADMVWLFRGSPAGAAHNYTGLVAILEAIADELNRATGSTALAVTRTERAGAQLAQLNLLALLPGAPELPLSVGWRDDIVIVALRERLLADILDLMAGTGAKPALAADPRFRAAFAPLPPAEDGMTFFDLPALLKPLLAFLSSAVDLAQAPGDVYRNTELTREGSELNAQALAAYQRGDIKSALALIEKLHAAAPQNALVLYNLACFNALLGNRDAALGWLEQAVDGGFCAPTKIAADRDLDSLRGEARYQAALAKAGTLAAAQRAADVVLNSAKSGEAYTLLVQASQAYDAREYEQGLKLVEQAHAAAPQDARVLYGLARFHALLGHQDQALKFLAAAVAGGFYCPRHIAQDPDLAGLRGDERYQAALTLARTRAAQQATEKTGAQLAWVRLAIENLADAVGIVDHVASVERTDGYSVWTDSVTALVPDAARRPVYPVLAGKPALTEFDRFLPQETASFSVSNGFDPAALYEFLEDAIRQVGPPGETLLANWAELQKQIGFDLRDDVIAWIDGAFVSVKLADGRGSVWLLKVTDAQAAYANVAAAIEFLSARVPQLVARNRALAPLAILSSVHTSPLERADLPGFQGLHLPMLPEPAVWGVAEGHLVLASSADAAALCLATARGAHPGIRKNARVAAEAIIPDGPFTRVTLSDEREFGENLGKALGTVSMVGGMLGPFVPEPRLRTVMAGITGILTKLTPVARQIDFYKSTASLTTFDGQRWYTRAVTHYVAPAERVPRRAEPAAGETRAAR